MRKALILTVALVVGAWAQSGDAHENQVDIRLEGMGAADSLIRWAADGFEIHYIGEAAQSGWQLREGQRPTAPYGAFDRTYEQDWVYVAGSGTLDQCNAAMVNGTFIYFATDTYPFFPRCFHGSVSSDFMGRR